MGGRRPERVRFSPVTGNPKVAPAVFAAKLIRTSSGAATGRSTKGAGNV